MKSTNAAAAAVRLVGTSVQSSAHSAIPRQAAESGQGQTPPVFCTASLFLLQCSLPKCHCHRPAAQARNRRNAHVFSPLSPTPNSSLPWSPYLRSLTSLLVILLASLLPPIPLILFSHLSQFKPWGTHPVEPNSFTHSVRARSGIVQGLIYSRHLINDSWLENGQMHDYMYVLAGKLISTANVK